jgi:hypothetical protein
VIHCRTSKESDVRCLDSAGYAIAKAVVEFLSLPPLHHYQWGTKLPIRAVKGSERLES